MVGTLVFFVCAAALSWAGFFFFGRGRAFSGENVNLEIVSPDTAACGEAVEYLIKYQNNETVPLGQAETRRQECLEERFMDEKYAINATITDMRDAYHLADTKRQTASGKLL